ncbi:hypothetical protein [Mycoplasma sp. HU2014]|uniref:hypothetical protein n=1 Tax=Mycoplasma sp. HU2014 TaxID=1664275 RepID=UPI00067C9A3A|nr:hypothetical protein [Mycoplasma sp. HU2014]KNG79598.1 membrane protein [Mycoplasma sp. HU2014]
MASGNTIMMVGLFVFIIGFVIWSTLTSRKANKKEKEKRYQQVRDKIKQYIAINESRKNLRIEFEKVYSRRGAEYKYRDVFDVIVHLVSPKTQEIIEVRAYEVEGLTTKINKNDYKTDWIVNARLDLEETKRRIAIGEKEIKLTKEEKKQLRLAEKASAKQLQQEEKIRLKEAKQKSKEQKKNLDINHERRIHRSKHKFVPTRVKEN